METTIPRRRRSRLFSLAAIVALVALLLPATAGVALGHHTGPSATFACDGTVAWNVADWTATESQALVNGIEVWYSLDGAQFVRISGTFAFTASNYLTGFGGTFSGGNATTVVIKVLVEPGNSWNDSQTNNGPWYSGTTTSDHTAPSYPAGVTPTSRAACSPTLPTTPSAGGPIGTVLNDTATVTGGFNPAGTVAFKLYGPNDPNCANGAIYAPPAVTLVSGSASTSPGFTTLLAGTYEWTAHYSGDSYNNASDSACGAESAVITEKASPKIDTKPSGTVTIGGSVSDSADLSGASSDAIGKITFTLYGPSETPACTGIPVLTSSADVSGNGTYGSGNFTPTAVGTYWWLASYNGDTKNAGAVSSCGDESVVVNMADPAIATQASTGGVIGTPVSDSATLSSASAAAGGKIIFTLYGPSAEASCTSVPVFTSADIAVSGNGTYGSGNFTPTAVGTYWWLASYSGDTNNSAIASNCGDELVVVNQLSNPTLNTTPSNGGQVGAVISDKATLASGTSPTGSITFKLFGPNNLTCSGSAVGTWSVSVTGNGDYTSQGFTTVSPGTYEWTASYTGDKDNNPAISGCGLETVVITQPTCEQLGTCPLIPSPSPAVSPSPSPAVSPSPSPSPQGSVEAATSKPHITPPPTSSLGGTAGGPSNGIWLVLLVLAGLLGSILLLTPAPARARRKR